MDEPVPALLRRLAAATLAFAVVALPAPPKAGAQGTSPVPLEGFERGIEKTQDKGNESARRNAAGGDRPRLMVAFLFDQYREDYLDRFRHVWGRDGFVRLTAGGARFHDCPMPDAMTLPSPGHATWLSGAPPSVHGLVANQWFDRSIGAAVSAVEDTSVRSVGLPEGEPGWPASPHRMMAQTVADQLRSETRGQARVVSISDKATAAIPPAGKRPTGVYWLDDRSGFMQTSTYYATNLPPWAREANTRRQAALAEARRTPWTHALPEDAYIGTATADPADVFPHAIGTPGPEAGPGDIEATSHPFSIDAQFDFVEAAVTGEALGADGVPDLLIVSVSITDYVGHGYGPDSPEVLDLAHRVDARLAEFLSFLDRQVGRGRWVATVTADHGVATSPALVREFEAAPTDSVGGYSASRIRAWIDRVLPRGLRASGVLDGARAARADTTKRWALYVGSGMVTFDGAKLAGLGLTRQQAGRVLADSALVDPWLAGAWTADDILTGRVPDRIGRQVSAGFREGRSGDVILVTRPHVFFGTSSGAGTSHGSPYRYDTHVPCLFYGRGVRRGSYHTPVSTTDIAPTVAALLGLVAPAQSEGRVLDEALITEGPGR